MYCSHCGKPLEPGTRFCAACGTAAQVYVGSTPMPRPLIRPREGRFIAGICAGFANAYGWDITLVRVLTVALLLVSAGTVALAYFALWIIIPEAPYALPQHIPVPPANSTTTGTVA
ncbi:MAG: hypothetical protein NVSMB62_28880 [Acidobacteriaceae bacterium]